MNPRTRSTHELFKVRDPTVSLEETLGDNKAPRELATLAVRVTDDGRQRLLERRHVLRGSRGGSLSAQGTRAALDKALQTHAVLVVDDLGP